jgi:hypothetical protein
MLWIVLDVDDTRLFKKRRDAVEYARECGFDEDFPVRIEIERTACATRVVATPTLPVFQCNGTFKCAGFACTFKVESNNLKAFTHKGMLFCEQCYEKHTKPCDFCKAKQGEVWGGLFETCSQCKRAGCNVNCVSAYCDSDSDSHRWLCNECAPRQ